MNEYFECKNCGQVVQGWNARGIECCENPDYQPTSGPQDEQPDTQEQQQ